MIKRIKKKEKFRNCQYVLTKILLKVKETYLSWTTLKIQKMYTQIKNSSNEK